MKHFISIISGWALFLYIFGYVIIYGGYNLFIFWREAGPQWGLLIKWGIYALILLSGELSNLSPGVDFYVLTGRYFVIGILCIIYIFFPIQTLPHFFTVNIIAAVWSFIATFATAAVARDYD